LKLAFQRLNIGPKTKLVDIGSGSDTALFAAAELGATATGVEINPFLTMYTRLRALASTHRRQISVKNQDFYKINLSEYDTVFMYLLPEVLEKLSDKIYTELTPGSRIISNTFPIPDKQPTQVIDNQFYVYIV
jgi:cyclopropane fatty-acyl-phospholipid synthase-like methyltransferase